MDPSWYFIVILMVLLVCQQAYWSFICFKLNDRLMSRDFSEFAHGERTRKLPKIKIAPILPEDSANVDPIAEENARRANSLLL